MESSRSRLLGVLQGALKLAVYTLCALVFTVLLARLLGSLFVEKRLTAALNQAVASSIIAARKKPGVPSALDPGDDRASRYCRAAQELLPRDTREEGDCVSMHNDWVQGRAIEPGRVESSQKVLADRSDVLDLAKRGAGAITAAIPPETEGEETTPPMFFSAIKRVLDLLMVDATVWAIRGNHEKAMESLETCVKIGWRFPARAFLIGEMVRQVNLKKTLRVLNRLLVNGPPSGPSCHRVLEALSIIDPYTGLRESVREEFRSSMKWFDRSTENVTKDWGLTYEAPDAAWMMGVRKLVLWLCRPYLQWERTLYVESMSGWFLQFNQALAAMELPFVRVRVPVQVPDKSLFARDVIPDLDKALSRTAELKVALDLSRLRLAAWKVKLETGAWPASIDALSKELSGGRVPLDLVNGKPYVFHASEGMPLIYSVGRNGIDDSGTGDDIHLLPPRGIKEAR